MEESVHRITHVQKRSPDLATTPDRYEALAPGLHDERVYRKIEAHPRRKTEDGAFAQDSGAKEGMLLRYSKQLHLRKPFGLAVVGGRGDRQLLRHPLDVHVFRYGRRVIDRGARGKEKSDLAPFQLCLFGSDLSELPCGLHVALAVEVRREVGRWIVG